MDHTKASQMTEDEWRKRLTPEQYHVLREGGTEYPGTGTLLHNIDSGDYNCAACGTLLFKSSSKYDSTQPGLVGWPSFAGVEALADGSDAVELSDDDRFWMHRTEIRCKNCGSHLGHVFPDDSSPTGKHYCINSCALDFTKK